uniref:Uncharacterized protein n=1 Tax=Mycena chlorophos TaxID=658473 RepID=A0ABQ0KY74_MYCCL|nr:predicted protein [Mycena chlorophos]
MHQAHNVAWESLSSNLVFVKDNRRVNPHRTDLFAKADAPRGQLSHFARTLQSTILEFSATERAKYPSKDEFPAPSEGKVFSDAILSEYCDLSYSSVTKKTQPLENWLGRAHRQGGAAAPSYSTSHGDLADVVKVLLAENQTETLMMLANHPGVPLKDLHHLSWGHSFGWSHASDWALTAYIIFNILLSKPELLENGRYKETQSYTRTLRFLTFSADYDAQAYCHREFLLGTKNEVVSDKDKLDPFADLEKLDKYLKMCFHVLYQYDMLARECGISLDWEGHIAVTVNQLWGFKTQYLEDPQDNWITRFA